MAFYCIFNYESTHIAYAYFLSNFNKKNLVQCSNLSLLQFFYVYLIPFRFVSFFLNVHHPSRMIQDKKKENETGIFFRKIFKYDTLLLEIETSCFVLMIEIRVKKSFGTFWNITIFGTYECFNTCSFIISINLNL